MAYKILNFIKSRYSAVLLLSLAGYIFSFLTQLVISYIYGTSQDLDAYWICLAVVNLLCFYLNPLREALIPAIHRENFSDGLGGIKILSSGLLLLVGLVFLSSVFFIIFHDFIFNAAFSSEIGVKQILVKLTPWLILYMLFFSVSELLNSVLISFDLAVSQNLIRSVASIIFLGAVILYEGWGGVNSLFIGQLFSLFFAISAALYVLKGVRIKFVADWTLIFQSRTFMPLFLSLLVTYFFSQLYGVLERVAMIRLGMGLVSSFQYSTTLVNALIGILVVPLTSLLWPKFLSYCQRDDIYSAKMLALKFSTTIFYLMCIFSTFIYFNSKDIVYVIYSRGAFDENSLELTSMTLRAAIFTSIPISILLILGRLLMSFGGALRQIWIGLATTLGGLIVIAIALLINSPKLIVWHWFFANLAGLLCSLWVFLLGGGFSKRQIIISFAWGLTSAGIVAVSALLVPNISFGFDKFSIVISLFSKGVVYVILVATLSYIFRLHIPYLSLWRNKFE